MQTDKEIPRKANPDSQQKVAGQRQALVRTKPLVVRTQGPDNRYTFDDVLALRFAIEDGSQLLLSAKPIETVLEFNKPMRITRKNVTAR